VDVEFWTGVLYALGPVILVGLLFWFIMRSIIRADRSERSAYSRIEAEERAKLERDR
jgi:flagellar biosynthesis/type III secretory pathway M-ring protein FliF/YscJ